MQGEFEGGGLRRGGRCRGLHGRAERLQDTCCNAGSCERLRLLLCAYSAHRGKAKRQCSLERLDGARARRARMGGVQERSAKCKKKVEGYTLYHGKSLSSIFICCQSLEDC